MRDKTEIKLRSMLKIKFNSGHNVDWSNSGAEENGPLLSTLMAILRDGLYRAA